MQKRKLFFSSIIIFAIGISLYVFNQQEEAQTETPEERQEHDAFIVLDDEQIHKANIEMLQAGPGFLTTTIQTPGKIIIHPDKQAHVVAKTSGIVLNATKNVGDFVSEGEVVAVLESKDVAEAKSSYFNALQKAQYKEVLFQEEEALYNKNISTKQDFLHAQANFNEAAIELDLAKERLHALGLNEKAIQALSQGSSSQLRIYEMRAPISGTIMTRNITQGEFIDSNKEIYIIADLSHVWVELNVYPKDSSDLKKGQNANVTGMNGKQAQAKITHIKPLIDEETRNTQILASLENNDGAWMPGAYITASIPVDIIHLPLVISKDAIQKIDNEDCVFIKTDKGFEIRPVLTGRCDGSNFEIKAGLVLGESYAAKNTFMLKAEHGKNDATHAD